MRLLADSNIVAQAVRAMRAQVTMTMGHTVPFHAQRVGGAGGELTKDHDVGALVDRDLVPHRGVLLVDDLGDAAGETKLILATLASHHRELAASAFLRASAAGVREVRG